MSQTDSFTFTLNWEGGEGGVLESRPSKGSLLGRQCYWKTMGWCCLDGDGTLQGNPAQKSLYGEHYMEHYSKHSEEQSRLQQLAVSNTVHKALVFSKNCTVRVTEKEMSTHSAGIPSAKHRLFFTLATTR